MKMKLNLKNREASLEADVEGIVKKQLDFKEKHPEKKSSYQIRQEEKRKNQELEQKHFVQNMILMGVVLVGILVICFLGSIFFE